MRTKTVARAVKVAAFCLLPSAYAYDVPNDPSGLWKQLPAIYKIHSGIVADRTPATQKDRTLTVSITGAAAKEIFDSIGPDTPNQCGPEPGERNRRKKGAWCKYTAQDANSKEGPYHCYIGIDLLSGQSTVAVSC